MSGAPVPKAAVIGEIVRQCLGLPGDESFGETTAGAGVRTALHVESYAATAEVRIAQVVQERAAAQERAAERNKAEEVPKPSQGPQV